MKNILAIIEILSKEERQEFLVQLHRKNRRNDTKNRDLFKLIASGKRTDLDILLYGKPSKNAYHALCKRLQDSLVDFVASKSFDGETSEELEILKLLLASRIFFEHKKYTIAFKTLHKASKKAHEFDLYSILNEIYHTKIQYAHLNPNYVLEDVIAAAHANQKLFQQELQLNMAYASIKGQLKTAPITAINEMVVKAFSDFKVAIDTTLTYKSLYQLMSITATSAKLQRDYYTISPFMMEVYKLIHPKKAMADKHRYYHIEILYLMAMTSFRNKDFEASMQFIREMEIEMDKNNRAYYHRFMDKLILIKALNHNYSGKARTALNLLKWYEGSSLDIQLVHCMTLFQQDAFSQAYQIFKKFQHSDAWYEKKMGWIWVLKKNIIELLLFIELDRLDLVLLRLQRFKRNFTNRLKDIKEERVLSFITFVTHYYENPHTVTTKNFKEEVENSFLWVGAEKEDIFVMSFYAWLKAKMENQRIYTTTLALVGSN